MHQQQQQRYQLWEESAFAYSAVVPNTQDLARKIITVHGSVPSYADGMQRDGHTPLTHTHHPSLHPRQQGNHTHTHTHPLDHATCMHAQAQELMEEGQIKKAKNLIRWSYALNGGVAICGVLSVALFIFLYVATVEGIIPSRTK